MTHADRQRHRVRADPLSGLLADRLVELGRPAEELERIKARSKTEKRAEWSRALYATGCTERAGRVARCASLVAAVTESCETGDITRTGYASQRCRDRVCTRCAELRALELGHDLRELAQHEGSTRKESGTALYFVTLTQPKWTGETARDALRRLMRSWAETTHAKYLAGARLRRHVIGGVRAVELTFSDGVTPLENGYIPKRGWHAHMHCLVEARGAPRQWWPMLWRQWCAETGADGSAQRLQPATNRRLGQLCKYPVKPIGVEQRDRKREVALALAGARLLEGWGSWRTWAKRAKALRAEPVERLHAIGTSLRTVVLMVRGESKLETPPIVAWKRRERVGDVDEVVTHIHKLDPAAIVNGGYLEAPHVVELQERAERPAVERELDKRWRALERELARESQGPPLDPELELELDAADDPVEMLEELSDLDELDLAELEELLDELDR